MRWQSITPGAEQRLSLILNGWKGTRYAPGHRVRGVACDCKEFVVGVLDELYRVQQPTKTARLAPDTGSRDIKLGLREIRGIMAQYPDVKIVRDGTVQPGDVLLVRSSRLPTAAFRPGHALIAGARPGTVWHCAGRSGVAQTSIAAAGLMVRAYRPGKKGRWA